MRATQGLSLLRACWLSLILGVMVPTHAQTSQHAAEAQLLPAATGVPATSRAADIQAAGYVEQEWWLQGRAQAYAPAGEWGSDGHWAVQVHGAPQPYATRILVRKPADMARFNGIVVVEWLNTTLGFDLDGAWVLTRDELLREGYAWVGVSAQLQGVQGTQAIHPTRYAALKLPSDDLSFDIYSQAVRTLRTHTATWLGTQQAIHVLGVGYSLSAVFLSTYINTFQAQQQLIDGFMLHGTAPIAANVLTTESGIFKPRVRTDVKAPVMQIQTEMEVTVSWPLSSTPDTDKVRYWEVAGAAHFDRRMQEQAWAVGTNSFKESVPHCAKPLNTLPVQMVDHAALHALRLWVTQGLPPPLVPRMARSMLGFIRSDDDGNAMGGFRLPEITVPTAQYGMYSNLSTSSIRMRAIYGCMAGGSSNPFDKALLRQRYPTHQHYVQRYQAAANALLKAGLMRPADHAHALERAQQAAVPQ
jgi:hypothetical protein